ncbi:UNVERIFIED_ORG: hypothetical protein QFZ59_003461 [Bacillus sp. B2I3]|nr:hypothetical protein [Bacillus sp. B2I3]
MNDFLIKLKFMKGGGASLWTRFNILISIKKD